MPHPAKKKQRLERQVASANSDFVASFDDLVDVLPNILGFLLIKDIMRSRRINKKTREAVRKTIVPLRKRNSSSYFHVDGMENYNAMRVMTTEMPNLQQITIRDLGWGSVNKYKWSDGEDPDEGADTYYIHPTVSRDIGIISNFSRLQSLEIHAGLNGRYPFLFNSFPLLQKLSIYRCNYLKWDLEVLAGLPLLKELDCRSNNRLTGNISRLRLLKDTLEKVNLNECVNVEGKFMDLADFLYLKKLDLLYTGVTGDIRDISENDFSSLEYLDLPKGVYGGAGYELQSISDGPDLVRVVYLLRKQRPALKISRYWYGKLSEDSPDWYGSVEGGDDTPPLDISIIEAGPRLGYRWETGGCDPCEANWLDPEPDRESGDYEKYVEELQNIESRVRMFKGFHQPPTEEEYHSLVEHSTH